MKTFTCYDCEQSFQSESREDILNQLYAHYMSEHKDVISSASETEKKAWMERFAKDWDEAKSVTDT